MGESEPPTFWCLIRPAYNGLDGSWGRPTSLGYVASQMIYSQFLVLVLFISCSLFSLLLISRKTFALIMFATCQTLTNSQGRHSSLEERYHTLRGWTRPCWQHKACHYRPTRSLRAPSAVQCLHGICRALFSFYNNSSITWVFSSSLVSTLMFVPLMNQYHRHVNLQFNKV